MNYVKIRAFLLKDKTHTLRDRSFRGRSFQPRDSLLAGVIEKPKQQDDAVHSAAG